MNLRKPAVKASFFTLALFASAAQAQQVQIYGKLYPYVINESGSSPTAPGTPVSSLTRPNTVTGEESLDRVTGMASGNSRFGFRGSEDLGGDLKAIFQLEAQVNVDDGTGGGEQFWNRDTFVGLDGRFGTLRLGNMDTVFKEYGDVIGILGVSSGTFLSSSSVLRKTGSGTSGSSSFHLRRINSLKYETPAWGGAQAAFQYSTDEAKTATRDPRVISMGVKYDNGPFYAAIAHERHYDLFGGSRNAVTSNAGNQAVNARDNATQATLGYKLGAHTFGFDVIRKEYEENATAVGAFRSYRNMAYMLSMENRWSGAWRTAAHVVYSDKGKCELVGAACSTEGLEGTKVAIAGAYYFSKRTYAFGAVNRLVNGKSARYSSVDVGEVPAPGEDITQVAIGLAHSF